MSRVAEVLLDSVDESKWRFREPRWRPRRSRDMNDIRSIRALLVVNTLLAGGLLWAILMGGASLTATAEASPQYRSTRASNPPPQAVTGVGNAAARQRERMITALDSISKRLQKVEKSLTEGRIDVRIENVEDLKADLEQALAAARTVSEAARA